MIHGASNTPLVGVVMQHPAIGTIHVTSCLASRHTHLADEFEQRTVHLRQITNLRRPIVHLQIDVRSILRVPRRPHTVIPQALKIGRVDVVRLRRADKQVAAVLEKG